MTATEGAPAVLEPRLLARARTGFGRAAHAMRRIGVSAALRYDLQRLRTKLGLATGVVLLTAKRSRYGLRARPGTSDFVVFGQTFISQPYAVLDDLPDVEFIVDCGANVGYASAFLLTQFPRAHLAAIEPDPENFAVLRDNLAPYGDRASAIMAGLWSHPARLGIVEAPYRGGGAWARQVRECGPNEPSQIEAIDIPTLLARTGRDRISILKLDIEGSECVVFAAPNVGDWLSKVDCLAVELHDDTHFGSCTTVFRRAIEGRGFALSHSGELTVCRRVDG